MSKKNIKTGYYGIITPAGWDTEGHVTHISLQSIDENEYSIERAGKGAELFDHLYSEVEIFGKMDLHTSGKNSIRVNRFKIIKSNI